MPFRPPDWSDFRFHFEQERRSAWLGLTTRKETLVVLDAPLEYVAPGVHVTVPKGFPSDGASVPKVFRSLVAMIGTDWSEALRAAVIHDWLHETQTCSWWQANRIFRWALAEDDANLPAQATYWTGVTLGGWIPWLKVKWGR